MLGCRANFAAELAAYSKALHEAEPEDSKEQAAEAGEAEGAKAGSKGSAAYWGITGMCEVVLTEQGRTMARSMGISESDSKQRLLCIPDPVQDRIKLYGDLGGAFSVKRNEPDLIEAWYKLKGREPMPPAVSVDRE